jgi:hypothetical protein
MPMINYRVLTGLAIFAAGYFALLAYLYWPIIRMVMHSHGGAK